MKKAQTAHEHTQRERHFYMGGQDNAKRQQRTTKSTTTLSCSFIHSFVRFVVKKSPKKIE